MSNKFNVECINNGWVFFKYFFWQFESAAQDVDMLFGDEPPPLSPEPNVGKDKEDRKSKLRAQCTYT